MASPEYWTLPLDWQWLSLRDIIDDTRGGTWGESEDSNGTVIFRPNNIGYDGEPVFNDLRYRYVPEHLLERQLLQDGDVFLTKSNSLEQIGRCAFFVHPRDGRNYAASNFLQKIRFDSTKVIPKYAFFHLYSGWSREYFQTRAKGTSPSLKNITAVHIQDLPVPLPYPDDPARSLAEQRRIVARIEALLAEVGEMRKLQGDIGKNADELMGAFLNETFNVTEMALWPNRARLEHLAEITARQVDPTLPEHRNRPHIYGKSIEEGTGRLLQYNTVAEDNMISSKYHFQPGAVLYSKIRPYLRKVTVVDFEGLCSADMYPLRVRIDELLPEFLMWTLLSPPFTNYANSLSGRARIPKLNRPQLFGYEMAYPAIEVQKVICDRFHNAREEIDELKRINDNDSLNLEQLEQGILAQAFQGEL